MSKTSQQLIQTDTSPMSRWTFLNMGGFHQEPQAFMWIISYQGSQRIMGILYKETCEELPDVPKIEGSRLSK